MPLYGGFVRRLSFHFIQEKHVRLKVAAIVGLGALLVGMVACGDPQRSTYVRYTPAPGAASPTASAT